MKVSRNHRLLLCATCCLLFFTGFSTTPGMAVATRNNGTRSVHQPAAERSPREPKQFSFEYDGLFYVKLSIAYNPFSEALQMDINTNSPR